MNPTPPNIEREELHKAIFKIVRTNQLNLGACEISTAKIMTLVDAYVVHIKDAAYAQGVEDALFRVEEHTPNEIFERNERIARMQRIVTPHQKEEGGE